MVKLTILTIFAITGVSYGTVAKDPTVHPVILVLPSALTPGGSGTATVTVDNAGTTDTAITLASSDPTQFSVPSSVTVPAGQTSVNFTVSEPASASSSVTVTASANGEEISQSSPPFNL